MGQSFAFENIFVLLFNATKESMYLYILAYFYLAQHATKSLFHCQRKIHISIDVQYITLFFYLDVAHHVLSTRTHDGIYIFEFTLLSKHSVYCNNQRVQAKREEMLICLSTIPVVKSQSLGQTERTHEQSECVIDQTKPLSL